MQKHFLSKCKNSQMNRPGLGKKVSTWPKSKAWERLHVDWGDVKDQANIQVIVDAGTGWVDVFHLGNRTSETVKIYLSQVFARVRTPRNLISDIDPEFVSGDLSIGANQWELRKLNHSSIIQGLTGLLKEQFRQWSAGSPNLNVESHRGISIVESQS